MEDKVIDSRPSQEGNATRRRRECIECSRRYTTYETIEEIMPHVIKKDGMRAPFNRNKIKSGILRACEKRPVSLEDIEGAVDRIEMSLLEDGDKEVKSTSVGEAVMEELRALDEVAYVRFASVYREFRDVDEFMKEIKELFEMKKIK